MILWIVWQLADYEAWGAKAYFLNETDAIACRDALRERDHAQIVRLRRELGRDWGEDTEYEAHPVTVHGTFAEWEQARDWVVIL